MKTLRSAVLAVGIMAALTGALAGAASAQTISNTAPEIGFAGMFNSNGITPVGPVSVPTALSGVGFVTDSILIPTATFFIRAPANETTARYTFTLTGLALTGTPTYNAATTETQATYTGGVFNIYFDSVNRGNIYANPSTFVSGSPILTVTGINVFSTFNFNQNAGLITGMGKATNASTYSDPTIVDDRVNLLAFLQLRGATRIDFDIKTFGNGVAPGYDFRVQGNADVIPEPGTLALALAGLLPIAGLIRRRRV